MLLFDDVLKIEDFDLDNISIDEKSNENIWVYNISYKNLVDLHKKNFYVLDSIKWMDLLQFVLCDTRYLVLFRTQKCDSI